MVNSVIRYATRLVLLVGAAVLFAALDRIPDEPGLLKPQASEHGVAHVIPWHALPACLLSAVMPPVFAGWLAPAPATLHYRQRRRAFLRAAADSSPPFHA